MVADQEFTGRIAVVTGGARGIGRACAELLSRQGASVVIVDRLTEESEVTALAINESGGRAAAVSGDLGRVSEISRTMGEAVRLFDGVDILVNNAGVSSECPTNALTEAQWDHVMAINFKAVFFVSQALLPVMVQRGGWCDS
ncbi:MAG: SDR family NAD(P)-dependent oxidoreductase [bacterium]